MPVVHVLHPHGSGRFFSLPFLSSSTTYFCLGGAFLLVVGVFITRRAKSRPDSPSPPGSSHMPQEKSPATAEGSIPRSSSPTSPPASPPQRYQAPHPISQPLTHRFGPPPPFPPLPSSFPLLPPPFTPPTLAPTSPTYSSFSSFESTPFPFPPRRRSYTKTITSPAANGGPDIQIQTHGEIIVADGWRRHTRVFGGGVCEACAESERRMMTSP